VEYFKYLGTILTNQNFIKEEIKSRLKPGIACYNLVQNLLSSSLLSKNLKIKSQRTIILSAVLNGCNIWSLTLREERRLMVSEIKVLRRISGPRRNMIAGDRGLEKNYIIRSLMICTPPQYDYGSSNQIEKMR
jgi:hypothetical protein